MHNWASMPVSLAAGVILTVNLPMAANLIMVRNPDTTNSIYISATANISSTIRDSVANVGNYGFLVRPMPLRTFYLLSAGDISGVEIFYLRVENPMDFLHLMAQPPTQLAAITSSALPSGASTEATQLLVKNAADAIKTAVEGVLDVQLSGSITSVSSPPVVGTKTITATAAEIFAGASVKANRRKLIIRNEDPVLRMRIGPSSVTQQNGYPIEPGATVNIQFDPATAVAIYGISEGAALSAAILEV